MNRCRRTAAVLGAVTALVAGGCTGDLPSVAPTCDNADALLLLAQAVPEAGQVPCFDPLPYAFEATTFDVRSGLAILGLRHEVIGNHAVALVLAPECTTPDGEPSDHARDAGRQLTTTPEGGAQGQLLFDVGACLLVDVHLDGPNGRRALDDLLATLQLHDRPDRAT